MLEAVTLTVKGLFCTHIRKPQIGLSNDHVRFKLELYRVKVKWMIDDYIRKPYVDFFTIMSALT